MNNDNEDDAAAAEAEGVVALINNNNDIEPDSHNNEADNNGNENNGQENQNKFKFLLNWHLFGPHMSACIARLMTDTLYSDVILGTADKRMIYAHRFILACNSRYFHRIFRQTLRPRGAYVVIALPEVKYETLKILMNYMYRGETHVSQDLLPSVLEAGRLLEINGLVNMHEVDNDILNPNIWDCANEVEVPACPELSPPMDDEENREVEADARPEGEEPTSETQNNSRTRSQNLNSDFSAEHRGRGGNFSRFRPILPKNEAAAAAAAPPPVVAAAAPPPVAAAAVPPFAVAAAVPPFAAAAAAPPFAAAAAVPPFAAAAAAPPAAAATATTARNARKEGVNLPVKRKYTRRDHDNESSTSTGRGRKNATQQQQQPEEPHGSSVKREKLEEDPWNINDPPAEEITVKTEEEFEIDDANDIYYNELYCETCQEHFSSAPEWVRHMSDQHEDQGLQNESPRETEDGPDPAVYHCVICAKAMYSASEWIQHIRVWHTDSQPIKVRSGRKGGRDPRDGPEKRKYAA